jgi:hypothetical protein
VYIPKANPGDLITIVAKSGDGLRYLYDYSILPEEDSYPPDTFGITHWPKAAIISLCVVGCVALFAITISLMQFFCKRRSRFDFHRL